MSKLTTEIRKKVKNTETFKSSCLVIKRMLLSRTNLRLINNGYNESKEIGFEDWKMITNSSINNQEIINELLKQTSNEIT